MALGLIQAQQPHPGTTPMREPGEGKSGRPLQCCVLGLLQHRDTIAMPQAGLTPAWGSGVSHEEGPSQGSLCP